MTRVLFHSLTIPPDNVSTGKLVADIANKFSENGQHIEILASTPQYNFDENVFNNELIENKRKKLYSSSYKNVKINHIYSSQRSFNRQTRIFQWISFHYRSVRYLIKHRKTFDVLYIFSYPTYDEFSCYNFKKIIKEENNLFSMGIVS